MAPSDEETGTEKALLTRRDLITGSRVLEQDVMYTLSYGFNTTVEQLKILNPGV